MEEEKYRKYNKRKSQNSLGMKEEESDEESLSVEVLNSDEYESGEYETYTYDSKDSRDDEYESES